MLEFLCGTAELVEAVSGTYSHFALGLTLVHEPAEGVVGDACSVWGDAVVLSHSSLAQVMCLLELFQLILWQVCEHVPLIAPVR